MAARTRRRTAAASSRETISRETTLRHVWLAGLGAVAVARRRLEDAARRTAEDIRAMRVPDVREPLGEVRSAIGPHIARVGAGAEARLSPLLVRLGLKQAPVRGRKARKPAARKVGTKKAARPAGRKAAAARMARRGR